MPSTPRCRLVFAIVALLGIAVAPARADKCTGAKLKAVAKKESGLLGCQSKVAKKGDPSGLTACGQKVSGKFSLAFAKAGTCGGDQMRCEDIADACESSVGGAFIDTLPSKCEASKRKAAGKLASKELGCYAKAAAKALPVDSTCLAKATGKFSTAITKAGTCPDGGSPQALVEEDCVTAAVTTDGNGTVTAICPTTTTTTTSSTTTTTLISSCSVTHLLISEVKSRGVGGSSDEFIELFNPTAAPVTLSSDWSIQARSSAATSYTSRWTGTGLPIPAFGHFLIGGSAYTSSPGADEALTSGITDASSIRLVQSGNTVDAVCYAFDATSAAPFTTDPTYTCEGMPAQNPHDNTNATDTDASIERKPGGSNGNCTDTGQNDADFAVMTPSTPQSSQSAPTP